jgi:hypothetical protein
MPTAQFNTPVLLCVYRRLDKTLEVLKALEKVKPAVLYVSANAPKNAEEKVYADAIKKAISEITWECTVHKKYEEVHIADCSVSMTKGINWFFSQVESGIILEDDCIVEPSFFVMCERLLGQYKERKDIFHISGTNTNYKHDMPPRVLTGNFSMPCWGWASWADRWKKYTPEMNNWSKHKDLIKTIVTDYNYWEQFLKFNEDTKIAWDIQWNVDIWVNKGKVLMPSYNTVRNIGFGKLATLTTNESNVGSDVPVKEFIVPEEIVLTEADNARLEENLIYFLKNIAAKS